jgi:hypothetical protein
MKMNRKDILFILAVFILLVSFKCLFATGTVGPIISDEVLYKINAQKIFNNEAFGTLHYPPLYSLLLSAAFYSKDNWYQWMLFINAMISSLIIIPVWLFGSRFLPKSFAIISVIISGLWSFHVAYPRVLMSENLYVPLFLFSVYIFLNAEKEDGRHSLTLYALFGIFTALAYLTKYIHLVAIPCFVVLWLVRPMFREDRHNRKLLEKERYYQAAAAATGFGVTYVPWVLYVFNYGFSEANAMGLHHLVNITKHATISSLGMWLIFYMAYLVLMTAPFLPAVTMYFTLLISGKVKNDGKETFYMATLLLLTLVFLLTAALHSWRAAYNYPDPNRIMGRYLIQFYPLYIILFMISLNKLKNSLHTLSSASILFRSIFYLSVFLLSQAILFRLPWLRLKFDFINNPDGVPYQTEIFTFFILFAFIIMTVITALRLRNENIARRYVVFFSVLLALSVQVVSSFGASQWSVIRNRQVVHSKMLADFIRQERQGKHEKITVIYDIPNISRYFSALLSDSLIFQLDLPWRDKSVEFVPVGDYSLRHGEVSDKLYLLTRSGSGKPLLKYVIGKMRIAEYELFRKLVLDRYPHAEALHHDQTYYLYELKDYTGILNKKGDIL